MWKLLSTDSKLHENVVKTAGIMTKRSVVSALKTNENVIFKEAKWKKKYNNDWKGVLYFVVNGVKNRNDQKSDENFNCFDMLKWALSPCFWFFVYF